MKIKFVISIIFLLCFGPGIFGMGERPYMGKDIEAPDFSLRDLNGAERKLSGYRGKVVLLNFWATNCDPCKEEMPSMQILYERLKGKPFVMLAVSLDRSKKDVTGFIQEKKYTFTVLLDPDKYVARLYQVTGIPTTFIIDKNGIIKNRSIGKEDWSRDETVRIIEDLIK